MKRNNDFLPLGIGLLFYSLTMILNMIFELPGVLHFLLLAVALVFEIWGIVKLAKSDTVKKTPLYQWKHNLLKKK